MAQVVYIDTDNSKLIGIKNYFPIDIFDLLNKLPFNIEPEIHVFGKTVNQKRDVLFVSDASEGYKYSGQTAKSVKFSEIDSGEYLKSLLQAVNTSLKTNFNGLLNRYTDGTKTISAHSDSEKDLDDSKIVASISFGATRTFRIRNKETKEIVCDIPHESGMLLLMMGEFQTHFKHEIPPEKTITNARISITFRTHKT